MGLDVGQKRIGVSISDELGWTAQGVEVIRRTGSLQADLHRLAELIRRFEVGQVIVGLPKNMNCSIGEMGKECQRFARQLEKAFDLPVKLWDERLSTRSAERVLVQAEVSRRKRKQAIDKMAATLILQSYLDAQNRS